MRVQFVLCTLVFLLILGVTTTGIFYKTPEPGIEHTTVRGQEAVYQGSGLYRYDPVVVVREGKIWDVINLCIGLPLLAAAVILTLRGSLRGRLLLGGLLAYFFYVYLMYATMMAFNPLFLAYVAIFSLSLVAFFLNMGRIDVAGLPSHFSHRFPRTVFIVFSLLLSAALLLLWTGRIVPIMMTGRFPAELAGVATLETQALDLGLIVPLALSSAILLWRRSPWGYFLTSVAITFGFMMFITIPAWIVVPLVQEGQVNLVEGIPFFLLCLAGVVLVVLFYRSVSGRHPAGNSG
jgi:hypothetical protein